MTLEIIVGIYLLVGVLISVWIRMKYSKDQRMPLSRYLVTVVGWGPVCLWLLAEEIKI